jgi:hypothetical protein
MQKPNQEYFYYNSIRNSIIVFMSLFRNLKVVDVIDDNNTVPETKETLIDITYTPKERMYYESIYEKLNPTSYFDTKVPALSVGISTIGYDPTRALNFYRTRRIKQGSKSSSTQYNDRMPIPYNINVSLFILAKYEGHIFQIAENIIPYIAPFVIVKIKENISTLKEVPRELRIDFSGDIGREIPLEYENQERRIIRSQLDFTIRGFIYKPLTQAPGPILHIPINFYKNPEMDEIRDFIDSTEVTGPNWAG